MEWVETTAKTVDDAKDRALDQLGVGADEAEFEIIEEPRSGLFGRLRGEARVRARVKPASVRPKQDRRQRGRQRDDRRKGGKNGSGGKGGKGGKDGAARDGSRGKNGGRQAGGASQDDAPTRSRDDERPSERDQGAAAATAPGTGDRPANGRTRSESSDGRGRGRGGSARGKRNDDQQTTRKDRSMNDEQGGSEVSPAEVGEAARVFMDGLVSAFGADATTDVEVDGTEIDVRVTGRELGLLVGPGGQTLTAVQDLARVAAQRRLGDHDTRLRIDVAGYREKRREALEKFAIAVANQVRESGETKALEPMSSADRKIVHDAIAAVDGVSSRSDGDDPARRVVISPE